MGTNIDECVWKEICKNKKHIENPQELICVYCVGLPQYCDFHYSFKELYEGYSKEYIEMYEMMREVLQK